jgi:hypothetical protein
LATPYTHPPRRALNSSQGLELARVVNGCLDAQHARMGAPIRAAELATSARDLQRLRLRQPREREVLRELRASGCTSGGAENPPGFRFCGAAYWGD